MKKLLTLILTVMMLGTIAITTACEPTKKLIVYTEAGFAPWEFTQEGSMEVIGVDMEIAKYIADKLGYQLEVVNGSFDSIVAGIAEDNALGIAGISYDAERAEAVEFSNFYWEDAVQSVVYLTSANPTLTEDNKFATSNFNGKKLVCQTGTTSLGLIEDNATAWGVTSKADFPQVAAALEEMTTGENTYLVVDSQVAAQLVASNENVSWAPIEGTEPEKYGVVAKKGNTELIAKVNEALAELLTVDEATGKNQIQKWFDEYSAISE